MAPSKMQRLVLTHEYELLYRPDIEHGNADALSRLPLMAIPEITTVPVDSFGLWSSAFPGSAVCS